MTTKFAIIGNGIAAVEAIKSMRLHNYRGEIHLFSDQTWPAYNPMLTTYYAAGKIDLETFFPYGSNMNFYKKYDVTLHLGSPVIKLDTKEQKITNKAGYELRYDKCLIATGARSFLPSIEGIESNKVFSVRTIEDSIALNKVSKKNPEKVIVVGASMTGIKMVELFLNCGSAVCLADMANHIFPLAAHPDCAKIVEDRLKAMGVKMLLGATISKIVEKKDFIEAHFKNIDTVEKADLIVMCTGVRPNIDFIDKELVEVDRGIIVDNRMRSSADNLYAAGDVAQGTNLLNGKKEIIALWANARYQGYTAGANMAGVLRNYPGNIPHNITHFLDMDFVGIGNMKDGIKEDKIERDNNYVYLVWGERGLQGINILGCFYESGLIKNNMIKNLLARNKPETQDFNFFNSLLVQQLKEVVL